MPKNTAGIGLVSWPIIFSLGSQTNPTINPMRIVGTNAISHALKMYFKGETSVMVKLDSIVGMNALGHERPVRDVSWNQMFCQFISTDFKNAVISSTSSSAMGKLGSP
jgi:hypothetical protein